MRDASQSFFCFLPAHLSMLFREPSLIKRNFSLEQALETLTLLRRFSDFFNAKACIVPQRRFTAHRSSMYAFCRKGQGRPQREATHFRIDTLSACRCGEVRKRTKGPHQASSTHELGASLSLLNSFFPSLFQSYLSAPVGSLPAALARPLHGHAQDSPRKLSCFAYPSTPIRYVPVSCANRGCITLREGTIKNAGNDQSRSAPSRHDSGDRGRKKASAPQHRVLFGNYLRSTSSGTPIISTFSLIADLQRCRMGVL